MLMVGGSDVLLRDVIHLQEKEAYALLMAAQGIVLLTGVNVTHLRTASALHTEAGHTALLLNARRAH